MYHKTEVAKTDLKSDDEESLSSSIGWSTEELGDELKIVKRKITNTLGFSPNDVNRIASVMFNQFNILVELGACKERVVKILSESKCDVQTSFDLFDERHSLEELQAKMQNFLLKNQSDEEKKRWERITEQSELLRFIQFHLERFKENAADMTELIDWMEKFTFEFTWDDIDVVPLEFREEKEKFSFNKTEDAWLKVRKCVKKINHLVALLTSDDNYDYMAGKVPNSLLKLKRREKYPELSFKPLWSSARHRSKLTSFEKMRSEVKNSKRREKPTTDKKITVLSPGENPKSTPIKELEGSILREISDFWKEFSGDVAFYIKESFYHRFTKPSCRKRLKQAHLIFEFITAATEGKMIVAKRNSDFLSESQSTIGKLKQESAQFEKGLKSAEKSIARSRSSETKLTKKIETLTNKNQKLLEHVAQDKDRIEGLKNELVEYKKRPTKEQLKSRNNLKEYKRKNDETETLKKYFSLEYQSSAEQLTEELEEKIKKEEKLSQKINEKIAECHETEQELSKEQSVENELKKQLEIMKSSNKDLMSEVTSLSDLINIENQKLQEMQIEIENKRNANVQKPQSKNTKEENKNKPSVSQRDPHSSEEMKLFEEENSLPVPYTAESKSTVLEKSEFDEISQDEKQLIDKLFADDFKEMKQNWPELVESAVQVTVDSPALRRQLKTQGFPINFKETSHSPLTQRSFSHPMIKTEEYLPSDQENVMSTPNYQNLFNSFRLYGERLIKSSEDLSTPSSTITLVESQHATKSLFSKTSSLSVKDDAPRTATEKSPKKKTEKDTSENFAFNPSAGSFASVKVERIGQNLDQNDRDFGKINEEIQSEELSLPSVSTSGEEGCEWTAKVFKLLTFNDTNTNLTFSSLLSTLEEWSHATSTQKKLSFRKIALLARLLMGLAEKYQKKGKEIGGEVKKERVKVHHYMTLMREVKKAKSVSEEKLKKLHEKLDIMEHELAKASNKDRKICSQQNPEKSFSKSKKDHCDAKIKLNERRKNLSLTFDAYLPNQNFLPSKLLKAKQKVKQNGTKFNKQIEEIKSLEKQLIEAKQGEVQELFMDMVSHRSNFKLLTERQDIDPALKKINKSEKEALNQILSKLRSRSEVADLRWKSQMKLITKKRQKILANLALVFHNLILKHKDIGLIEPFILIKRVPLATSRAKNLQLHELPHITPKPLGENNTDENIQNQPHASHTVSSNSSLPVIHHGATDKRVKARTLLGATASSNCPFSDKSERNNLRLRGSRRQLSLHRYRGVNVRKQSVSATKSLDQLMSATGVVRARERSFRRLTKITKKA